MPVTIAAVSFVAGLAVGALVATALHARRCTDVDDASVGELIDALGAEYDVVRGPEDYPTETLVGALPEDVHVFRRADDGTFEPVEE